MRHARVYLLVASVLIIVSTTQAQQWSQEQQEVWEVVKEMSDRFSVGDVEGGYKFVHPDLVWWNTKTDLPGDYNAAKRLDTAYFQHARTFLSRDCVPLTIQVYDSFAVVNFQCRGFLEPKEGENPEWSEMKLHFVMIKEGEKWLQVANFLQRL